MTPTADCLFCDRAQHRVLGESASWYIRLDNYPAHPGHSQVVPKRHVESLFELNGDEAAELYGVLLYARDLVVKELDAAPDAWTVGVNEGRAAGRTIDHLHVHLIPRYWGDVPDPRGGIRQCAPRCTPDAWTPAPHTPAAEGAPEMTPRDPDGVDYGESRSGPQRAAEALSALRPEVPDELVVLALSSAAGNPPTTDIRALIDYSGDDQAAMARALAAVLPEIERRVREQVAREITDLRDGTQGKDKPYNRAFMHALDCAIRYITGGHA